MSYSAFEWKDKTVLVTGATGMLGRSAIRLLQDAGVEVSALVRDGGNCPQSCKALICDIRDFNALVEQLQSSSFDFVLHFAAQSQVDGHLPMATFESNILSTINLLEALRVCSQEATIIVASTDQTSGNWHYFAATTADTVDVGPYCASKMCAEILAHCYTSSFGMSVGVVRLTNLYGPCDRNMRRLVPGTICSVLENQAPILRSKPETPVNFLYVDDAAAAILCLAEQIAVGRTSLRMVTVRNQLSTTLGEMVDTILACMERPELRQETACGRDVRCHDPAGVETLTGEDWVWKPRVSLEDGLRKTISWYQQNFAA